MGQCQIAAFRCEQAQCFCCSVDHILPETGAKLDCDRTVVYGAIRSWYEDGLEQFEEIVQDSLFSRVERQISPSLLRYADALHIAVPYFWVICCTHASSCTNWSSVEFRVIDAFFSCFGYYPLLAGM